MKLYLMHVLENGCTESIELTILDKNHANILLYNAFLTLLENIEENKDINNED